MTKEGSLENDLKNDAISTAFCKYRFGTIHRFLVPRNDKQESLQFRAVWSIKNIRLRSVNHPNIIGKIAKLPSEGSRGEEIGPMKLPISNSTSS
jgi:hypothetical protein